MPAYKDKKTGKWYASFYCMNWKGVREKKMKRGFETKKAALEWEREFLRQSKADLDMRFDTFVELYVTDLKQRLRENTFLTKESIIYKKVLPYFKEKKLKPKDKAISSYSSMSSEYRYMVRSLKE